MGGRVGLSHPERGSSRPARPRKRPVRRCRRAIFGIHACVTFRKPVVFPFIVQSFNPSRWCKLRVWYWLICGAAVGGFVWAMLQFYFPKKGFTCLIYFGGNPQLHRIAELRPLHYYVYEDRGYDGQYYAQIAVKPHLLDPDLREAMDNLAYRARRILFSWTAYVLGLGQPWLVLQVYALQNAVCWLLLAWLLFRWFPPDSPGNLVRWLGTLFAWGLTMSVRQALTDGPTLLLIAWGVSLAERGRRWPSAGVLGIAGLGRETGLLAGIAHAPGRDWSRREVWRALGRGLAIAAPLVLWSACLGYVCGEPSNAGAGNFALPFAGYITKWSDTLAELAATGWNSSTRLTVLLLISLTAQVLALLLRPQWNSLWWRVGAAYALLLIVLGGAVWEGYPGAAARVVLPMTLAFNVVVPRTRRWWPVLLLGNLSVFSAAEELRAPAHDRFLLKGLQTVWLAPERGAVDVVFDDAWYETERSHFEFWSWSRGSAGIVIRNPQPGPIEVELSFALRAFDQRTVRVLEGKTVRWEGQIGRVGTAVRLPAVRLKPGDNPWWFETDKPPIEPDQIRAVAFNLRNFTIQAVRKVEPPPAPGPPHPP